MTEEFREFPSISRLSREMTITEKIDGTNAQIHISTLVGEPIIAAGSRSRWVTPEDDNFGFARWVRDNKDEVLKLGPGLHYGEWWGKGIQRGYGLDHKRFSLFNTGRWNAENVPSCIHIVPVLYVGLFDTAIVDEILLKLHTEGSVAAPGFMKPEGVVVYHKASNGLFKKTLDNNDQHKFATFADKRK